MVDAASPSLVDLGPIPLADLMLGASLEGGVTLAVLEPGAEHAMLSFERAGRMVARCAVPSEVATAVGVRLALMARLDPDARAGTSEGAANVARIRVRAADGFGELLVSVVARNEGLEAEVRVLSIDGRRPATSRPITLKRCTKCGAYQPAQSVTCEHDGAALVDVDDRPESGGTIGQYVLGECIGEGGDGIVFRGKHAVIDRPVAIKLLRRGLDEQDARRFATEARAMSRLRHPNVVEVTDFGLLSTGQPFIVMEELRGQSLYTRMHADAFLDPGYALRVGREIARALGAAHEAGIIHNDLKPGNVMLLQDSTDEAPRLKVLDFGAASQSGRLQESADGLIFGTCEYMSPELGRGLPTDARSDIYALGIVLFEMLTGSVPFPGTDVPKVIRAHALKPLPTIQRGGRSLPVHITRVVSRCLRKSPDERPQTADELAAELDEAIGTLDRPAWARWLP